VFDYEKVQFDEEFYPFDEEFYPFDCKKLFLEVQAFDFNIKLYFILQEIVSEGWVNQLISILNNTS